MERQEGHRVHWAYIGSFTSGGGRGITVAAVDPDTGALTPRTSVDTVTNPSGLALDPGTGVLYAACDTDPGTVAAFRTGPDGSLAPLGPAVDVAGSGPAHLSVAGGRLYTANYGSGSVSTFAVRPDGSLAGPPAVLAHHGSGPDAERQRGPHAHQVLTAPGGRWVLSVDLGTDSVRVCAADPATGGLRVHEEAALRSGSGPRHLAFHPAGEVVYVLHELEPLMTVCRWDAAAGRLEPLTEVAIDSGGAPAGERVYPSVVHVAADGRFVRAAVRGAGTVLTFSLADGAEKPRLTSAVDCGGVWPRDLVAGPSGRTLYIANEWSGDVTWFHADPESGALRRGGRVEVPAAACVVLS
ncbi:lactonase family protein [Streptomyces lavendofoliae]|uniref:lactonase family protein n=1 Tax=Streptomyces lavendofoliae TaxID=67314 RepID=UPI003D903A47